MQRFHFEMIPSKSSKFIWVWILRYRLFHLECVIVHDRYLTRCQKQFNCCHIFDPVPIPHIFHRQEFYSNLFDIKIYNYVYKQMLIFHQKIQLLRSIWIPDRILSMHNKYRVCSCHVKHGVRSMTQNRRATQTSFVFHTTNIISMCVMTNAILFNSTRYLTYHMAIRTNYSIVFFQYLW